MDGYTFTLLIILIVFAAYTITLYHLAHGNERKATRIGADIVLESMERDARIAPKRQVQDEPPPKVGNIGEEDFSLEDVEVEGLPDIIVARSAKHAEQIGDRITDDLLKIVDGESK